jgi:clan AA aspartic protease
MGVTFVNVKVANPADPSRAIEEQFLVDSGAVYSLVPRRHLEGIGIEPHSRRTFILANGEQVERDIGTAIFEYQGRRGDSLVIFGEEGDSALLGATTLEGFGLILDPFRRELKPLPMVLA